MKPLDKSLIVLSVLVAMLAAQHLYALSCMSRPNEEAQLELDSVEVDGQPQQDLSAYDGYSARLGVNYNPDDVVFEVEAGDGEHPSRLRRPHQPSSDDDN